MPRTSPAAAQVQQSRRRETIAAFDEAMYQRIHERATQGMRPEAKARYLRLHRVLPEPEIRDDGYHQTIRVPSLSHPGRTHTVTRHWERHPVAYACDCQATVSACWHTFHARAAWDERALRLAGTEADRRSAQRGHQARYGADLFRVPA